MVQYNLRLNDDSREAKWFRAQSQKKLSLEIAINAIINTYGYVDLTEVAKQSVTLDTPNVTTEDQVSNNTKLPKVEETTKPEVSSDENKQSLPDDLGFFSNGGK